MDLQQEQPDVELQHMEEQELEEELQAVDEEIWTRGILEEK